MNITPETLKGKEKQLFDPYLSDDPYLPKLKAPFLCDGYICATETHILLRVRQDLLPGYEVNQKDVLNIAAVIHPVNCDRQITLPQLRAALEQCPLVDEEVLVSPEVPCPECDGEGFVQWEYTDKDHYTHHEVYNCPVCDGTGIKSLAIYSLTGRKAPADSTYIAIGGIPFSARFLLKIADTMQLLGIDTCSHIAAYPDEPNIFTLADGLDIILMPVSPTRPTCANIP